MTAQEALKAALRDVLAPRARTRGFKGSAPTWRRETSSGDWAVVNVQSSSFSSSERLKCVINLAVAPEPWLRWNRVKLGRGMPKTITESLGLYRDRLHASWSSPDRNLWWEITDSASAESAVADMLVQLDDRGWPVLDRLLHPGGMLEQVQAGSLGYIRRESHGVFFAHAEAILLMDRGLSPKLDELLRFALENAQPRQRESVLEFDAWVREQAISADRSGSRTGYAAGHRQP